MAVERRYERPDGAKSLERHFGHVDGARLALDGRFRQPDNGNVPPERRFRRPGGAKLAVERRCGRPGSAKLAKRLRRASSGRPATCLYSSRQTKPVAIAVVVAIAGMIRPAFSFAWNFSISSIP